MGRYADLSVKVALILMIRLKLDLQVLFCSCICRSFPHDVGLCIMLVKTSCIMIVMEVVKCL